LLILVWVSKEPDLILRTGTGFFGVKELDLEPDFFVEDQDSLFHLCVESGIQILLIYFLELKVL
jgi:hypothetical protein